MSPPATPDAPLPAAPADGAAPAAPAKISAYYSLVFPNITFFLQTLTVTIGRRCISPASASPNAADPPAAGHSLVDVDLGPLKSVSRLHARIEYEEEDARFVLVVIGRNGAWVDGIWSGTGSRVPLGERSQIQIASRTFHFVLPPPAALEDSPSPSSASSMQRARSPSVDITSISPPSSIPSHSPSPRVAPALPASKSPRLSNTQLPDSNGISPTKTPSTSTSPPASRKRKKTSQPPLKPDIMPPKPPLTYAQLCYRAIKAMEGKATLQDICGWMVDTYDWYRFNKGAGWENSVRHNLSSGRAFKKMERSTGERGKGFFWSVDPQYEHTFEVQEARAAAHAQSASAVTIPGSGKQGASKSSRKRDKAAPLDPPLKRSVKSGLGPLPPPLTSTPLISPVGLASDCRTQPLLLGQSSNDLADAGLTLSEPSGSTAPAGRLFPSVDSVASSGSSFGMVSGLGTPASISSGAVSFPSQCGPSSLTDVPSASSDLPSPFSALPPSVCLPVIVGPIPSSHPSSSIPDPPPIILHDNTLILSPVIFSSLASEQLKALEEMGAQKALEVLQGHIVRYLKERMGKKKRKKAAIGGAAEKGGTKAAKVNRSELSSPFTTIPLPSRSAQSTQVSQSPSIAAALSNSCVPDESLAIVETKEGITSSVRDSPPGPAPLSEDSRPQASITVVDSEDGEAGRITKKRKLGSEAEVGTQFDHKAMAAQISQTDDEDIEVDVC